MKASILRSSLILFTLGLLSHHGTEAESCARLTDDDSTFLSSLGLASNAYSGGGGTYEFDFSRLQNAVETIDSVAPWLSQCVASIDVGSVIATIFSSEKFQRCYADIALRAETFNDDPTSGKLFSDYVCPLYTDVVVPCLNDVLVDEILMPAIANPCCDSLKSVFNHAFGADLPTEIKTLSALVGNALCATKAFKSKSGDTANQTCGDALVATFTNSTDGTELFDLMLDAMQIPTEQVCAAVVGKPVVLASGKTTTFPAGKNGASYGICFQPMSALVDHVSAYPVLSTLTVPSTRDRSEIPLSAIFTPGTCVPMTSLFMALSDTNNSLAEAFSVVEAVMGVFDAGPSSMTIGSRNGSDSVDDSHRSGSRWLLPVAPAGLGARMLIATNDNDDDDEGSDGSSSDDGGSMSDSEEEPKSQWPSFTVPGTDLTIEEGSASGDDEYFPMCLHFPHGVPCDFGSSSITLPYTESGLTRRLNTRQTVALRTVANVIRRLRQ